MSPLTRPLLRRLITVPAILLAATIAVLLTIPTVAVLALVDLAQGNRRGRLVRLWMLVVTTLWVESAGVLACTYLWIIHLGRHDSPRWLAANYRLEFWWGNAHLDNFRRWAAVRIHYPNPGDTEVGDAIVVSRHSSHVDALVPLQYIGSVAKLLPRYTLKQELQWAPAMDIVGSRTSNVWLDRTPDPGSEMFKKMEALSAAIDEGSAAVIFPEGTFFTPQRRDRAAARLATTRPDLEKKARELRYLLPPRPAGTAILLAGAPEADVVVMANVGLETFGSLKEITANIATPKTVEVRLWRHDRSGVPTSDDDIATWLLDRWTEMDDWIHDRLTARAQNPDPEGLEPS